MEQFSFKQGRLTITADEAALRAFVLAELNGKSQGLALPRIGERWAGQGGFNGGLVRGTVEVPDHFLIVSPDEGYFSSVQYGSYGKEYDTANDEWDGFKNTQALVKLGNHPAAEKCAAFTCEGHSDYFLAARRQGAVLYGNVPELFKKEWHWTSTRYSANNAWMQNFGSGGQDWGRKVNGNWVRAVRRVFLSDLII